MLGDYPKGDTRYNRSDAEAEVNVGSAFETQWSASWRETAGNPAGLLRT